jgi:hypothetical protein
MELHIPGVPISGAKQAHLNFFAINFTVWSHILSTKPSSSHMKATKERGSKPHLITPRLERTAVFRFCFLAFVFMGCLLRYTVAIKANYHNP